MPRDNNDQTNLRKLKFLDITAKKLISTIDPGYEEKQLMSEKDNRIQNIINGELELRKGISQGSIIDFITDAAKDSARYQGRDPKEVDSFQMFTEDVGNLFGYFHELYKNRYVELTDLKLLNPLFCEDKEHKIVFLNSFSFQYSYPKCF